MSPYHIQECVEEERTLQTYKRHARALDAASRVHNGDDVFSLALKSKREQMYHLIQRTQDLLNMKRASRERSGNDKPNLPTE